MLTTEDRNILFNCFPKIKLSYENIIHKKVYHSDFMMAVPKGKKAFAWFTVFNNIPVCYTMTLNEKQTITNIRIQNVCSSKQLYYGTIFYGTLLNCENNFFFTIENIYMYKGNDTSRLLWDKKLTMMKDIFKKGDLQQLSYNKTFLIFTLPIIVKTDEEFTKYISQNNIPYSLYNIQYHKINKPNSFIYISYETYISQGQYSINKQNNLERISEQIYKNKHKIEEQYNIYEVTPDIQNDIYHLYSCNNNKYVGVACIPDYNTSVMMNNLFRNIKENIDLDKLEESDEEEEFENPNINKYVFLENRYKIRCVFNNKFKKWVPLNKI